MRRTMLLGVLLAVGAVGIVAGQAPQQANVAEIEKVRDNLFMIKGAAAILPHSSPPEGSSSSTRRIRAGGKRSWTRSAR